MVEAVRSALCRLVLLLALLALPSAVDAHREDEYLQATLVAIEPGGEPGRSASLTRGRLLHVELRGESREERDNDQLGQALARHSSLAGSEDPALHMPVDPALHMPVAPALHRV